MRAGKLDRVITIERSTTTVDDYGATTNTWSTLATMRAQVIQASTEEYLRASGAVSENVIVFRLRWLDDVTVADRIMHDGTVYGIREVKPIGRRRGLEIRCTATGT